MRGGDLSSFEARYSFCLDHVADVLDIFFSISLFLLGSVYSRVFFSRMFCFQFTQLLHCYCFFSLSFAGFAEGYHLG